MTDQKPLRLLAEEGDDLKIIAAAVQDAVVKAGNLKYEKRNRRFAIELNRYRWETAPTRKGQPGERVRTTLSGVGAGLRALWPNRLSLRADTGVVVRGEGYAQPGDAFVHVAMSYGF